MRQFTRTLLATALILFAAFAVLPCLSAEEPVKEGGWLRSRDEQSGLTVQTMEMTLHPKAEPRPALKYRLVAEDFDMLDGNAAVHYMKALGFLEQGPARKRLSEVFDKAMDQARKEGKPISAVAPFRWQSMAPEELPLKEVKAFLRLTAFQSQFIAEGAKRRSFNMDRNIRNVDNPIAFLLPEVQSMREVARMQNLRCKVAIAEGRIDDAIKVLGQQYAMARHLGQDDFLVSALVGIALGGIAWDDALYLVQHEDTPNLYWAFATLPHPMIDIAHSLSVERQFLFLQFKTLREVDETPRPAGYWRDFVDRLAPEVAGLSEEFGLPSTSNDPKEVRTVMVAFIAMAYPSAKRYLIEQCGLDAGQVEAYPTAQTVFLAIVRYYERARDSVFKWCHVPYWQAAAVKGGAGSDYFRPDMRAGWIAKPATTLLPAIFAAYTALAQFEQKLALVQAVEAIRMYGASHDGKLPPSLDDLPVPVPMEPFTGRPLDYRCYGDHAVLSGHDTPGFRYQLVLRFAK